MKRGTKTTSYHNLPRCSNNIVASGEGGSKNEADSEELFTSASSFEYSHTIEQILKQIQLIEEGKYGKFDEEKEGNGKRELMEVTKTPEDRETSRNEKDLGFLLIENDILRTKLKLVMAECSSLKDRVNRVGIVACDSDQENQRGSTSANEDGRAVEGRKPAGDIGGLSMATCGHYGMHGKSNDCLAEDVFQQTGTTSNKTIVTNTDPTITVDPTRLLTNVSQEWNCGYLTSNVNTECQDNFNRTQLEFLKRHVFEDRKYSPHPKSTRSQVGMNESFSSIINSNALIPHEQIMLNSELVLNNIDELQAIDLCCPSPEDQMQGSSFCRCHNPPMRDQWPPQRHLPNPKIVEQLLRVKQTATVVAPPCDQVRLNATVATRCQPVNPTFAVDQQPVVLEWGREWDEYGADTATANAINRQVAQVAVKDMEMEFEKSRRMRLQLLASTYCTRRRGNPSGEFRATGDVTGMEELGNSSSRRLDHSTGSGDKENISAQAKKSQLRT